MKGGVESVVFYCAALMQDMNEVSTVYISNLIPSRSLWGTVSKFNSMFFLGHRFSLIVKETLTRP